MVQVGSSLGLSAPQGQGTTEGMGTASRRRHRRVDALGRCFAQLGGGWEASVLNLSVGGMYLRLKRELTPGSTYVVKLFLEDQVAIVEARVLRASEAREERECFVALQFTSIPGGDAACLRGFINR